ncbi:hypothetical protein TIN4_30 [Tsukamurella phage TIN4]|uniref:Lysin B n=2 Tax=Tinduovirus TIN3 TaxID=1982571 RepID=A0A0K0N5Q8_9CAUD|nr:hypothetical protein AVT54_gp095 [Tsukamurella phage TIN3]YP_009604160.1 hypothetical protein FDH87_gp095 [Tsukamurella phage TIN4]AKJ71827.1 hypothetical protein TIN3_30 [Tsukamurella phage TIN3]AKJ71936.1 hypothetical protein TIN4_30 [Tsukamurella phage TIN4]
MSKRFFIFDARGITESYEPVGNFVPMLTKVIRLVKKVHPDVVVEHIQYRASISAINADRDPFAPSGDNGANDVVKWLRARIAKLGPEDYYIILGYSGGAVGTTRHLKLYGGDHRCLMYGNIANPSRAAGNTYGVGNGFDWNPITRRNELREGIYATQGTGTTVHNLSTKVPLVEIANPNDVMTSCPKASPLHAFAGPVMAFDFRNPFDLIKQLRERGIEEIARNMLTVDNWLNPGWRSWPWDLDAYMKHTHTTDYELKGWADSNGKGISGVELLARQINWRISRVR